MAREAAGAMITVVQRVARASVAVDEQIVGSIAAGLLLLVGVEASDTDADADATAKKIASLRCFPGRTPMDKTVGEIGGGCLVVSQFTLCAELAQGNRPSFTDAAAPTAADGLYRRVAEKLREHGLRIATGSFGAKMLVDLCNDGPVTFVLTVRCGRASNRAATGAVRPDKDTGAPPDSPSLADT